MTTLAAALRKFEATEANLGKLEKLWDEISKLIPSGPAFGSPPEYDELCLAFRRILPSLPGIDGFRLEDRLYEYDEAGQMRLDALEVGEIGAEVSVSNELEEQGRLISKYRFHLNAKRRELVRGRLLTLIEEFGRILSALFQTVDKEKLSQKIDGPEWSRLKEISKEVTTLLGSSPKPPRWSDLNRHLHFGMMNDLMDILEHDWPAVKDGLESELYGDHDPIPVDLADLGDLVAARPTGPVTSKLSWSNLNDEDFERLMFCLISETPGYENPQWLQPTHAPDRGRDISVIRVDTDPLAGVRRHRIIIQCKHWQKKSVALGDVSDLRSQMELWHPPRVDGLVIATSGRFTADAIVLIERHNQEDRALHISMWPDSHLEMLLAARPHLIAQFRLRGPAD
jgi:Restriction endonuclease